MFPGTFASSGTEESNDIAGLHKDEILAEILSSGPACRDPDSGTFCVSVGRAGNGPGSMPSGDDLRWEASHLRGTAAPGQPLCSPAGRMGREEGRYGGAAPAELSPVRCRLLRGPEDRSHGDGPEPAVHAAGNTVSAQRQ